MNWIEKWFDETNWPHDARLDVFRDAVWELSFNGELRGWVTTSIGMMRSFPIFWEKQEQMWFQVHWEDGTQEQLEEDYGPGWYTAEELLGGSFVADDPQNGKETTFAARPISGDERDELWSRLGMV